MGIGLPITRTVLSGAKVNISMARKRGLGSITTRTATRQAEASFRDGKYEGACITYHENGNLRSSGAYPKHVGKSYDGKKEGPFYNYEEDGKTVWLIITYKRGGSRAKPDEYPLGVCDVCSEVKRLAWKDTCPKCGAEL